jgi:hypothetical protein
MYYLISMSLAYCRKLMLHSNKLLFADQLTGAAQVVKWTVMNDR